MKNVIIWVEAEHVMDSDWLAWHVISGITYNMVQLLNLNVYKYIVDWTSKEIVEYKTNTVIIL